MMLRTGQAAATVPFVERRRPSCPRAIATGLMRNAAGSTPRESGLSGPAIARRPGRDRTTVWREVRRNSGRRGCRHKQARRKADRRRSAASHVQRTGNDQGGGCGKVGGGFLWESRSLPPGALPVDAGSGTPSARPGGGGAGPGPAGRAGPERPWIARADPSTSVVGPPSRWPPGSRWTPGPGTGPSRGQERET